MSKATDAAIARYVRKGGNEAHGRALLAQEVVHFSAKNLPAALVHWGFATPASADRLALELAVSA